VHIGTLTSKIIYGKHDFGEIWDAEGPNVTLERPPLDEPPGSTASGVPTVDEMSRQETGSEVRQ
jgi:hypothetical protein